MTLLTLIYYLRCAWTNPGYLIGSILDEAKKNGAYDPKMYALDNNMNADLHSRAAQYYYDGKSQDGNDMSMIDNGDISPTGAASNNNNVHNR